MRCTRNDEQGDCRTAFHFRSYRHYAPAKHYPQITDSAAGLTIYAIVNKLVELSEVKMNL